MKKSLLLIAIIALLFTACKKDGDSSPVVINPNASITCKVDGVLWTALTRVTSNTAGNFIINGTTFSGDALNISTLGDTTGTYTLGTLSYHSTASYSPKASNPDSLYTAINGTVIITEVDDVNKRVSGTFQFNCVNVLNQNLNIAITEGEFLYLNYH
ncbi:MAG: hypothetical protein C0592_00465 [Marinilabiliales bacterium]|mgnify:CR=1 FL=1|nr:MAG: hypothetical protein C0592_00465 [Marinilabiliales bacterium]